MVSEKPQMSPSIDTVLCQAKRVTNVSRGSSSGSDSPAGRRCDG